jgi:multidrug transporter EmrE-like cation transporter
VSLDTLANIIGMMGTACVVGAYFMIQVDRMDAKGLAYNVWNLLGAFLLLLSLLVHFNLASFVIELFWIAASLVGLRQYFKQKRRVRTKPD